MRFAIVLALVAVAAAIPTPLKQHAADQEILKKQQDIIYLLEHITQQIPNQEYLNLGTTYDIENNSADYVEPEVVQYYVGLVHIGDVQPQGTPFSTSVSQLRKEVALLTRILVGAKNYNVFIKTAAWARVHVNEEQFVKALIAALLQRPDTQGVIPPALYEILPHHYFDSRVIHEAQNYVLGVTPTNEQTVVIPVNYTDSLPLGEHHLSYFTHDIGLAVYYAFVGLAGHMVPEGFQHHGINAEQYQGQHHNGQGAIYHYLHQQLLAHYNLERLSNGLGPIHDINFEHPESQYHPHLQHINGLHFPGRSSDIYLTPEHHELVQNVHALEHRLMEAIDTGYVITPQQAFLSLYQPQGLNILGELIQGTGRSVNPRFYGSFQAAARQLLGNAPAHNNIWDYTPSALDLHETCPRDPAFWQLYKRIIHLFHRYQESLPAYQYNDVALPGVHIEQVIFPDLFTYFEHVHVDLENAVVHPSGKVQEQEHITVKAQVPRLNHRPYEYQVIVNSEQSIPNAVVRVYLGPKHDYDGKIVDINHHRHYFVELDQFVYQLQQGKNVIVRDSYHAPHLSYDHPTIENIKVYIQSAIQSQNPYYIHEAHQIYGFPARLAIPKGHHGGLPLQVVVVISSTDQVNLPWGPVVPAEWQTYQSPLYQVVGVQHYPSAVQGKEHTGVHQSVDVVPHWSHGGIYGKDVEKLMHYYGHYLYKKYPNNFPFPHIVYHHGAGQTPVGQVPVNHQSPYYVQHGQHGYQHGYQSPMAGVNQIPYGQGTVGGVYQGQGVHQGQGIHVPQGVHQTVYPHVHGVHGVHGLHGVQGVQDVQGVQGVQVQGGQQNIPYSIATEGGVQGGEGYNVYKHNVEYLNKYYQSQPISHIIGGAVSLDGKPFGWPFDRPLGQSALYVPNIHVADVVVYHEDSIYTH